MKILLIGPNRSGKSTIGKLLAKNFALSYVEGDLINSENNLAKFSKGLILNEDERNFWVRNLLPYFAKEDVIVTASLMRKSDRKKISKNYPEVRLVQLVAPAIVLKDRLPNKESHAGFKLIENQLLVLDYLSPEEHGRTYDASKGIGKIFQEICLDLIGS